MQAVLDPIPSPAEVGAVASLYRCIYAERVSSLGPEEAAAGAAVVAQLPALEHAAARFSRLLAVHRQCPQWPESLLLRYRSVVRESRVATWYSDGCASRAA